ncbi:MAG TPA: nucleotidyltransferase family protein, partial [Dongiaceae bacterium]|nr:nucleotidyltransferase family protein [Dongiaceae bacterium]
MTRSLLSREAQLLVLTAGGPANERLARLLLAAPIDWTRLGYLAQHERATTVLWRWLARVGRGHMPAGVEAGWRRCAMVAEFEALRLEQRLQETVTALAGAGIEVMLLKGSALAYTTYSSFTDRPMGDLDVLVRPEQARDAWALLQRLGWTWPATRWPAERYTDHQHLPPLLHADDPSIRLEVHTDLIPDGHPFRMPALWPVAQTIRLQACTALVPDPLHQLLHLCIHFAWSHQMQWGAWRTFRDVDALTRGGRFAWGRFAELARTSRAATICYWALRLARDLAGTAVPNDF